eukprot:845971-Pyramimonas_sp.AAC.1
MLAPARVAGRRAACLCGYGASPWLEASTCPECPVHGPRILKPNTLRNNFQAEAPQAQQGLARSQRARDSTPPERHHKPSQAKRNKAGLAVLGGSRVDFRP